MKDYFCVKGESRHSLVINKSRFICSLYEIDSIEIANEKIREICKNFNDATHNCYAFISDTFCNEMRFSDDGEPQGTAGLPMLQVLKQREVCKTLAIVTRYFGGVKLGAGGLVSAYTRSVAEALDNAKLKRMKFAEIYDIKVQYFCHKKLMQLFDNDCYKIIKTEFNNEVEMQVAITPDKVQSFIEGISEITLGKVIPKKTNEKYIDFN